MKKALAACAFALVIALPQASLAVTTITSSFAGSSTGTTAIQVGDFIDIDISIFIDAGQALDTLLFSMSGDIATSVTEPPGGAFPLTQNYVTAYTWEPHPTFGAGVINGGMGTTAGFETPAGNQGGVNKFPGPTQTVAGSYGFAGVAHTGAGVQTLVGTVTIVANAQGVFLGGAFHNSPVDGFFDVGALIFGSGAGPGVSYTVIPEPGTAILMFLGLGGLGVMGRKSRN